jgi:type VI secretion system protein VasG
MNANHLRALIEKLSPPCRTSLEAAVALCVSRTHYAIEIEHIVFRLSETVDTDWARVLEHFALDTSRMSSELTRALDRLQAGNGRAPAFSRWVLRWLGDAWLCASIDFGASRIRSGHLLLAALRSEELEPLLRQASSEWGKLSREVLEQQLAKLCSGSSEDQPELRRDEPRPAAATGEAGSTALERFTIDLTAQARAGKLDEVLGRDPEIRQMTEILLRYRQNNPILVGEAGVGKTAVVEGLALKIARGEVPEALQKVALRTLDLGLLQAGAGVRGEFESRLKSVLDEVKASPRPIILFIDEAHTLVGAGGQSGQGDAANLLKPALARGELRTIAATTWAEYKQYFENDAALTRRFQLIKIGEPSEDAACVMLRGLVATLERHHKLRIQASAVDSAVRLSHRYIADRQLPDKAVGVLSTACARVALGQQAAPAAIEEHRRRIAEIDAETALLTRDEGSSERLGQLAAARQHSEEELSRAEERWQRERALVEQLVSARVACENGSDPAELDRLRGELADLQGDKPLVHDCVNSQAIAEVVASWTGIPVGKMVKDELHAVLALDKLLRNRVVGQDHALATIAERVATSRAEMEPPNRPTGVFLLVGPSGVGKTETALALADALYGGERNVITFNMSEYKEPHSVAGLKGAPPGYVGYGKGGLLTEAVRRRPYSVVLLDEFEKAHKEVKQMFYAVFDTGLLTDSSGREVSFRNTIILLTSNVAARKISALCADPAARPSPADIVTQIRPELVEAFEEALLGRMLVVPYYPLAPDRLRQIVTLQLDKIVTRLWDRHRATLTYDEPLIEALVGRCDTSVIGARAIEQTINRSILSGLSKELLAQLAESRKFSAVQLSVGPESSFQFQVA